MAMLLKDRVRSILFSHIALALQFHPVIACGLPAGYGDPPALAAL
jgi:hypothetical protein